MSSGDMCEPWEVKAISADTGRSRHSPAKVFQPSKPGPGDFPTGSTVFITSRRSKRSGNTLALIPVTLAPVPLGLLGPFYLAVAVGLDGWFGWHVVRVLRERTDASARRLFHVSLVYLFALFFAMLIDCAL